MRIFEPITIILLSIQVVEQSADVLDVLLVGILLFLGINSTGWAILDGLVDCETPVVALVMINGGQLLLVAEFLLQDHQGSPDVGVLSIHGNEIISNERIPFEK